MTAVPVTPPDANLETGFYDAVRPFALLAVVAFLAGFVGYVVLGQAAGASPQPASQAAVVADPATAGPASDDWNVPKHI